jgi:hypothetical protein
MYYDFLESIMISMINKRLLKESFFIETLSRGSVNRGDFNGDLVIPKTHVRYIAYHIVDVHVHSIHLMNEGFFGAGMGVTMERKRATSGY